MPKFTAPLLATGLLAIALAGCSPIQATRGNIATDQRLAQIEPGVTSRVQVQYALGTPTATGTVDDKTWYYIGFRTAQTAFFEPEITSQRIVKVRFNDEGIVETVEEIDGSQARHVDPVDRSTPTAGREVTFVEQLLGNVNRSSKKKEEK
ncbi:outer membrane protein assembly factor BamE [Indioceanicola profundi]|uniref:outer membrane protein assembly factor BamE n=1 Tax=Indioceanicola profundi TaxID=2220096 RepID=UPI000E6AB542|nr:outer membrane protein assembly factor BamE [Indioceanicola profundi]